MSTSKRELNKDEEHEDSDHVKRERTTSCVESSAAVVASSSSVTSKASKEEPECGVCYEPFSKSFVCSLNPCAHEFCVSCVIKLVTGEKRCCPFCRKHIESYAYSLSSEILRWFCNYASPAEQRQFFYGMKREGQWKLPPFIILLKEDCIPRLDRCAHLFRNGTDRAAIDLLRLGHDSGLKLFPISYTSSRSIAEIADKLVIPCMSRSDAARPDDNFYNKEDRFAIAIDSPLFDSALNPLRRFCATTAKRAGHNIRIVGLHCTLSTCETTCGAKINAMQYYVTERLSEGWSYERIAAITGTCALSRTLWSLEDPEPSDKDYVARYENSGMICRCEHYQILCRIRFWPFVAYLSSQPERCASIEMLYNRFGRTIIQMVNSACFTDRFGRFVRAKYNDHGLSHVELCATDLYSIPFDTVNWPFPVPPLKKIPSLVAEFDIAKEIAKDKK